MNFHARLICVISALSLSLSVQETGASPPQQPTASKAPPEPPEFKIAQTEASTVLKSDLPDGVKDTIGDQFKSLSRDFENAWAPYLGLFSSRLREIGEIQGEEETLHKEEIIIESHRPDPKNAAAVGNFNIEVKNFNLKLKALELKDATAAEEYLRKEKALRTQVSECQTSLNQFNLTVAKLLTGKVSLGKGLAWRQLVEAAKAPENAAAVFDGNSIGKTASPDTVDARGEALLTPEERKKMQELPTAQRPRGFRATSNGEPPPPAKQ